MQRTHENNIKYFEKVLEKLKNPNIKIVREKFTTQNVNASFEHLDQMLDNDQCPTEFYFSKFITQLKSNKKNYPLIKKLFAALQGMNIVDEYIYSGVISAALSNEDMEFAKEVFAQAEKNDCFSYSTLNMMLDAAGKNKEYSYAKEKFDAVYNNGKIKKDSKGEQRLNVVSFRIMVNIASLNNKIQDAKDYYDKSVKQGLDSNFVLNMIIDVTGKNGDYAYAKAKFDAACANDKKRSNEDDHQVDTVTYVTIINVALLNNQIEDAKYYCKEGWKASLLTLAILNFMIDKTGKNGDYAYAKLLFDNTYNNGNIKNDKKGYPLIDTTTFSTIINVAILNDELQDAKDYYAKASKQGLTSSGVLTLIINATSKAGDYTYASDVFDAAYNNGDIKEDREGYLLVDRVAFTVIIQNAISHKKLKDAKYYFNAAVKSDLVSNLSLNMIVDVAGKNDDYDYAADQFDNAYNKGKIKKDRSGDPLVDIVSFTAMINVALLNNKLKDAKYYCDEAVRSNLLSAGAFNMIIDTVGKNDGYDYAADQFEDAYNNGKIKKDRDGDLLINARSFNTIINLAILNHKTKDVKYYCNKAIDSDLLSASSLNMVIDFSGKNKDYVYAKNIFDDVYNNGSIKTDKNGDSLLNDFAFNTMINIAVLNDQIEDVKDYCDKAFVKELMSCSAFVMVIDVTGKNGNYAYAKCKFDAACDNGNIKLDPDGNLLVSSMAFNAMVNVALLNNQIEDAKNYYNQAEREGLSSHHSLDMIINATGKNNQYIYAKSKFDTAYKNGKITDVAVFRSMINIALLNSQIDDAKNCYDNAFKAGLLSSVSLNQIIRATSENGNYAFAKEKFDEAYEYDKEKADQKNDALVNLFTCSRIIHASILNNQIDDTKHYISLFNRLKLSEQSSLKVTKKDNNTYQIDLHGCTYVEAYVGLYVFVKNKAAQKNEFIKLNIIHGLGKHSVNLVEGEDHDTKKATNAFLDELEKQYSVESYVRKGKEGQTTCEIDTKQNKQEKRTLETYEDQPEQARKKLKSEDGAKELISASRMGQTQFRHYQAGSSSSAATYTDSCLNKNTTKHTTQ